MMTSGKIIPWEEWEDDFFRYLYVGDGFVRYWAKGVFEVDGITYLPPYGEIEIEQIGFRRNPGPMLALKSDE